MASLFRRATVFAAAFIAIMLNVPPATAALPAAVLPAPVSDYPQFRKLAKPLRVLDLLCASQHDLALTAAPLRDLLPKWHDAYDAALARGVQANSDALTDAIMHAAFVSFSHAEVERLSLIAESPFLERFQTAKISALYSENADLDLILQALISDPDYIALSPADRQLLSRLIHAAEGSNDLGEVMRPIVHAAVLKANASLDVP